LNPIELDQYAVRRTAAADLDPLSLIWLESAEMLAGLDPRITVPPEGAALWLRYTQAALNEPHFCAFTAWRRERPAGYIFGRIVPDPLLTVGLVEDLAVDSHGRGGGPGRLLWDALRGWFTEQNITLAEVRVPTQSAIAQAFWRASGAREWYDLLRLKV